MLMRDFWIHIDDLLRGRPLLLGTRQAALRMGVCVLLCSALYGAAMGTFAGSNGIRALQVLFSALKVPLLMGITFGLSLPSFFIVYSLWGLRDDFALVLRSLLATQTVLCLVLASLAPFTLLWYASSGVYQSAILFNTLMFAVASCSAQISLRRFYRPLIQRDARHRTLLWLWLGIYGFIGVQMGWTLRPFVGDPSGPVRFFRTTTWGNAYEALGHIIWKLIAS